MNSRAQGQYSSAFGQTAEATADLSTALGYGTSASATRSLAAGSGSVAAGESSVAIGDVANASAERSVAIGELAQATRLTATAIGSRAKATGTQSTAVGVGSTATKQWATAVGFSSDATGLSSVAIGDRTEVSGKESIGIGKSNVVSGVNSIAVGSGHTVSGDNSGAFGDPITITGDGSYGFGNDITIASDNAFAIGSEIELTEANALAFGNHVQAGENAVGIGQKANASALRSVAIGEQAEATRLTATALGSRAKATGIQSTAVGVGSTATKQWATAVGFSSDATGLSSVAMGDRTEVSGKESIGIGKSNVVSGVNSIAVGSGHAVSGVNSIAVGSGHTVSGNNSGAFGDPITITGDGSYGFGNDIIIASDNSFVLGSDINIDSKNANAIAIGNQAAINATSSVAIGQEATAGAGGNRATSIGAFSIAGNHGATLGDSASSGNYAVAVGSKSNASIGGVALGQAAKAASNATALGRGAEAKISGGVALGHESIADTAAGIAGFVPTGSGATQIADINSTTSTQAAVSVGGDGEFRQITNVAAGTEDGDAVNVAQLRSLDWVVDKLADTPLTFAGDTGTDVDRLLGEKLNVVGGVTDQSKLTNGNIGVVADGTDTLAIQLAEDIDLGPTGSVTVGSSVLDNSGLTVAVATGSSQVGAGFINVSGLGGTVTIDGNYATIGGLSNLSFDPEDFTSGQAATEDQLAQVSDDLTGLGLTFQGDDGVNVQRDLGETLGLAGGANIATLTDGNIGVVAELDGDNNPTGNMAIQLAEDIDLGPAGSVTVGSSVLDNSGLTVAVATGSSQVGAGFINVSGLGGTVTIDGNYATIGGLSNLSFDPEDFTSGQAATEDQLAQVSDDLTSLGLTFQGDDGVNVQRDLGETLGLAGGANIATLTDGNIGVVAELDGDNNPTGNMAIQLAENIDLGIDGSVVAGGTKISNRGLTFVDETGHPITNTPTISVDGISGGHKIITDVGSGLDGQKLDEVSGLALNNAVNVGDLQTVVNDVNADLTSKGLNFAANKGAPIHKDLGETLSIVGTLDDTAVASSKNIRTETNTDGNLEILLAEDLVLTSLTTGETVMDNKGVRVGDNVNLTNTGLFLTGGPSVSLGGIDAGGLTITNVAAGVNDTDAVNVSQLKDVQQNVDTLGDRAVKYDGTAGSPKDTITLAGENGTLITNLADGAIESGSTDAVNGGQIYNMGESIAAGMGGNSKFEGGKLITELDVAGNTYFSVNDALTGVHGDLSTKIENVESIANAGWNVTDAEGNTSNIGPNGTVSFVGDSNISVAQTGADNAGQVEISLSQDLKVNSVTASQINATSINTDSIAISNGGPIINQDGINMGGNRITNVAPGVEGTDAVNIDQLMGVGNNLQNQISGVRHDMKRLENRSNAGIAAAMATAGLPQAYLPGKSMVAVAGGVWRGESGMAIGVSTVSDNGKWILKGSANTSGRGGAGGTIGAGYQW